MVATGLEEASDFSGKSVSDDETTRATTRAIFGELAQRSPEELATLLDDLRAGCVKPRAK